MQFEFGVTNNLPNFCKIIARSTYCIVLYCRDITLLNDEVFIPELAYNVREHLQFAMKTVSRDSAIYFYATWLEMIDINGSYNLSKSLTIHE